MFEDISDCSNLNSAQKSALLKVLKKYPGKNVFPVGLLDDVIFSFRIVKHLSSDTPRFGKPGPRVRYEVLDNAVFDKGGSGAIYKSLFTISLDNDDLTVKSRKPGTLRLVKEEKGDSFSPQRLSRIQNECQKMQRSIFFHAKPLGIEPKSTFIVMRLLPGENMYQLLQRQYTVRQTFNFTMALLSALKTHIYDKHLVHKDIKASNILVNQFGDNFEVFIIDYGLIKDKDYDDSQECAATELYAPPEYFTGEIITTHKYDIYLMGRLFMYLWGGYDSESRTDDFPEYETAADPEFDNMFIGMVDKPTCQQEIKEIVKRMCREHRDQRPDVNKVIEMWQNLENSLIPVKKMKMSEEVDRFVLQK